MGSMGSPSAKVAEVATSVMGAVLTGALAGGAVEDVGAGVRGGGNGGNV